MISNRLLLKSIILLILVGFVKQAIGLSMSSTTKYEYQASESAPLHFPMQIISGSLTFSDGSGSLSIPSMKVVANGWGDWRSSHVLDSDEGFSLPNKLELMFFSFTENQFYKGEFDLPYEKIETLFTNKHYSFVDEEDVTFDQFIIGVTPGGGVSLWLNAIERRVEVFSSQAEKVEGDWMWVVDNPEVKREEYIKEVIEYEQRTPEQLEYFKKNGVPFGKWKKYSEARYLWKPVLNNINLRDGLIKSIHYFNGEKGYIQVSSDKAKSLAVPDQLSIIWNRTGFLVNDLVIDVTFDEFEIFSGFEKLATDSMPIEMEFRMEPENNYDFTIWLRNEKNNIELKKTKIKTWKPGGMRYENAGPKDTE